MPRFTRGPRFLLPLVLLLSGAALALVERQTSGDLSLAELDGSRRDADGTADGVWTVDGSLAPRGRLLCGGEEDGSRCEIALAVAGDLELRAGSGIEAARGLEIEVAGDLRVEQGAFLAALDGGVEISAGGRVVIDGLVSASVSAAEGAAAGGRLPAGSIAIRSGGEPGQGLRLGPDATLISEGGAAGGNAITLSGCGIEVLGLVAAVTSGPGARVAIDSCAGVLVDGRDLGPNGEPEGPRRGRIEVSAAAGNALLEINAVDAIALDGGSLAAAGGGDGRISVSSRRGAISWRRGAGVVSAAGRSAKIGADATSDGEGRIRLAACDGVDVQGSRLEPAAEVSLVDSCADGRSDDRELEAKADASSPLFLASPDSSAGTSGAPVCAPDDLVLASQTVTTIEEFIACNSITASDFHVIPRGYVIFRAGNFISLGNDFSVEGSSYFEAILDPTFNQPPVAQDDAFTIAEDSGTLMGDVLADNGMGVDSDPDGDPLTVNTTPVSGPANGSLTLMASGAFSYDPDADFSGVDMFEYELQDGNGGTDVGKVTITVTPVNDPPVANPDAYSGGNDGTLTVPDGPTDLLANDTDADPADMLVVSEVQGAAGNVGNPALTTQGGTVTVAANGSFVYDPTTSATLQMLAAGATQDDTFTYQASDGNGGVSMATATITVTGVPGTITITKTTLPAGGTGFGFTDNVAAPNAFTLDDGQTKTFTNVDPGAYTVIENDPTPGFDLTMLSCTDPDSGTTFNTVTRTATIDLDPGETVACTFTNTQRGSIVVEKQTDPDGAPEMFTFTGDAAGMIADEGTITVPNLVPGTYTSTEDDPTVTPGGFDLTAISCDDGGSATPSTFSVAMRKATFEVDPGETVKCTFTNTRRGSIVIVKDTVPDGAQDFAFTTTGGLSPSTFDLDDDSDLTLSNQQTYSDVVPGSYSVSETPVAGFDTTLACVDPDGGTMTAGATATIDLDPGETVTCTFTNTQRGSIEIVKDTVPNGPQDFSFTTTGGLSPSTFDLDDDSDLTLSNQQTYGDLVPGSYSVSETPVAGFDTTLACVDPDGGTMTAGATATIDLDPGETVTCTFTNTQRGSIVIKKTTTPSGGTGFGFTDDIEAPNSFTLDDGQMKTFTDVLPATYAVAETTLPAGWSLVSATCDDGSPVNAIVLDPGETVTCTFDNAQGGTIIVKKTTSPAGGTGFTFSQDMDASGNFMLDDGQMKTFSAVPAGTYAVAETPPAGWVLSMATCDDGSPVNAIDLSNAETVTCTFTNTNPPPVGGADSFDFVGNTLLLVDKATSGGPEILVATTAGTTPAADGVLDNDADPQGEAVAVAGVFQSMTPCADATAPFTDCPTVNGGKVTMEATGQFSYTPKAGDTAATDMFGYNLSDGINPPVGVVVTLTRKNRVWYVKNDHTPNGDPMDDGTSTDPLPTLAAAATASLAGDTIYVFNGDDMTTGQSAGVTLKSMQRLLGEGVDLAVPDTVNGVAGPTLFDSAANPRAKIENTGDAVTVDATGAAGNHVGIEIRGLEIVGAGTVNAVDVTASGSNQVGVTIADNRIADSTAEALDLNAGGSALFEATIEDNAFSTTSPTGNAIDVVKNGSGDVEVAINDNVDVTSAATAIRLDGSAGTGTLFVTGFSGNSVHGNTGGGGISIATATFDADTGTAGIQQVSGGATTVGSAGNRVSGLGVRLATVKGNLSFADLDVFNDGATGLEVANSALAAGDLVFATSTGTIDTLNGTGLDLDPLTVDLVLASVTTAGTFAGTSVRLVDLVNGPGGIGVDINGGSLAGSTSTIFAVGDGSAASGGTAKIAYDGTMAGGGAFTVAIQDRAAGANDVTFAGAIGTMATPLSGTILADDNAAGSILFSAPVHLATGASAGVSLTDNTGATISFTGGLNILATSGAGLAAAAGGTVTVTGGGNTIATGSGTPLNITDTTVGAAGVTFATLNSTMAATGINLSNTGSGPVTVTGAGSSIAGASSRGVDIQNHDGNFSYAGSISTAGAGRAVEVTNSGFAGGTAITFSGAVDDNGGGINLDNNDQGGDATITFSGGLTVDTTNVTAFRAVNGGIVNVNATGGAETLTATAGKGVDIDGVRTGITFDSISTTGSGSEGIELRNLAATSSFAVSGTTTVVNAGGDGLFIDSAGGAIDIDFTGTTTVTNAGSEGIFLNDAPAGSDLDFGNVAVNSRNTTGIFLDNVAAGVTATFADVDIPGGSGGGYGVRAEDSAGAFSFASVDVSNTTRTAFETRGLNDIPTNDGDGDGIFLKNVTGGFTITGAGTQGNGGTITTTAGDGIDARSSSGLSLTDLTISRTQGRGFQGVNLSGSHTLTDSTIKEISVSTAPGAPNTNGLWLANTGATTLTGFTVSGTFAGASSSCNFTNTSEVVTPTPAPQSFFLVQSIGSGDMTVTVDGCVFEELTGQAFQAEAGTAGGTGAVDVTVQNNRFRNASTIDPFLNSLLITTADADADLDFTVHNNLFDDVARSVASLGNVQAVRFQSSSNGGDLTGTFSSNAVRNITSGNPRRGGVGFLVEPDASGSSAGTMDVTISDNVLDDIVGDSGIFVSLRGDTGIVATNEFTFTGNEIGACAAHPTYGTDAPCTAGNVAPDDDAIFFEIREDGGTAAVPTVHVLMQDNNVHSDSINDSVVDLDIEDATVGNFTLLGNTFTNNIASGTDDGLIIESKDSGSTVCLDLNAGNASANTVADAAPAFAGFLIDEDSGTFRVDGLGTGGDASNVETFLGPKNTGLLDATPDAGANFVAFGDCPQPTP